MLKSPVLWAVAVLDHQIFYTCSLCRRLTCGFESFRVYASSVFKLFGYMYISMLCLMKQYILAIIVLGVTFKGLCMRTQIEKYP
jgi:hypothetical protein